MFPLFSLLSSIILINIIFVLFRYVPFVNSGVNALSAGILGLLDYAHEGALFIFGDFANSQKYGFAFILTVVPTIIFFGALIGLLYFFGIIQYLIAVLAYILRKTVRLTGVESMIVIADIFLGQSEGPLVIGPYIKTMSRSELALAFTAGLANLSGSTLGMYLMFLSNGDHVQSLVFANYLVTATFMNAISAIIFAKILFPESLKKIAKDDNNDTGEFKVDLKSHRQANMLDSIVSGAMTGLKVGAAIVTVLLAVISLIHLLDGLLASLGNVLNLNQSITSSTNGVFSSLSIEYILGQIFRIFAFFMGITWSETLNVGSLLGQKVAINEFVAYMSLGKMKLQNVLSDSAIFTSTFALASFSNFSSIGISLGVFSVLAPTRQKELAGIAWKAFLGAVLAGFMTASIAGLWHSILG